MGENQEKARVKKSGDTDCPFNIFLWRSIPTIIYERIYSIPRCHIPCNVLYLWWKIAAQQIPVTWTKYYKTEKCIFVTLAACPWFVYVKKHIRHFTLTVTASTRSESCPLYD